MSSGTINVRQIGSYPRASVPGASDLLLLQQGGLGGPYASIEASDLVMSLTADVDRFTFSGTLIATDVQASVVGASSMTAKAFIQDGDAVATVPELERAICDLEAGIVTSVNGRAGDVLLDESDILRAGAAPVRSPCFSGWVTAPTPWDVRLCDNTVVTANWVQRVIEAQPATAPTPPTGDASDRIATTAFVDDALADYAPLYAPSFSGTVTAPQTITTPVTVARLPPVSAAMQGARCFVTDATATGFLSIVAGGGSNKVPVVCDGAHWLIG